MRCRDTKKKARGEQTMKVNGVPYRTIWLDEQDDSIVHSIDQTKLPHVFQVEQLTSLEDVIRVIKDMHVRGAILIGAAAAFGMYFAAREAPRGEAGESFLRQSGDRLKAARPTAVNLSWAVDRQLTHLLPDGSHAERSARARETALAIVREEEEACRSIGEHGLEIMQRLARAKPGQVINILTHCNAGWLGCIDHGTATALIYAAFDAGLPIHVWVDETRPWNQGARLTAWELGQHGVPHTVIADNTGGHLMQHGLVDLVVVGSDRTTRTGDVANKIGTYLKALAAQANQVPFYVALTSSTFDWSLRDGVKEIPIEERGGEEVRSIQGWHQGHLVEVRLTPENSPVKNYGFDVTPASLVTGLITERGICEASESGIRQLFPELQD